jgi:protein-tyrosine-phosphatase
MEFDDKFLQEMGLQAMPEDQKQKFLDYVQEELEVRIGERISKGLTQTQLNEFDMITDPAEAANWLEKNRPDYREIVNRTIEEMKEEIRANRARLIGTA